MNFAEFFGHTSQVQTEACGRVNIIGEHTDYNEGFVLPTTIPQKTCVEFSMREDQDIRVASLNLRGEIRQDQYILGDENREGRWSDYIKGITRTLQKNNFPLKGFDAFITSNVPMGSGLSSSAALEVSFLRGLNELFQLNLSGEKIARLAQQSENEFVGAHVGIMDPLVISLGKSGEVLFVDTRDLAVKKRHWDLESCGLLVINSSIRHRNNDGGYNKRRQQCEEACALLQISSLRDLDEQFISRLETLPEVLRRRARHVITENARVLKAVVALDNHDLVALGQLLKESHRSLRDNYEVSIPEIDFMVESAWRLNGVFGARITGGGFGGSIIILTEPGKEREIGQRILKDYEEKWQIQGHILVPQTTDQSSS